MDKTVLIKGPYHRQWIPDPLWIHLPGQYIRIRSGLKTALYQIDADGRAHWNDDAWSGGVAHDYLANEVQS